MNTAQFPYLKFSLRRDMEKNACSPSDRLLIDDERHTFQTYLNGEYQEASYIASLDTFGGVEPILVCSYGLDSAHQYNFSKSIS